MPIELVWLIPDSILLSHWSGTVSVDDVCVLIEELSIILDEAPGLVHTVIDLSEVTTITDEVVRLYGSSRPANHPRRGRIGIVNPSKQAAALSVLLNRGTRREMIRFFDTQTAARDYLLSHNEPPPPISDSSA